jgi:diadenylate cyclase
VGFLVSSFFQLAMVTWLLRNSLPAMLVAIPILFQPELRRVLEQIGRGFGTWRPGAPAQVTLDTIDTVSNTCHLLAQRHTGALIVLERETGLQDYVDQGFRLDALLSPDLLVGLFHPSSPFHDGAVVLRRGRIVATRCVMPLSESPGAHMAMGMRHRAALGIAERTDAIAVAVSEERGTISVASNGRMVSGLDGDRLRDLLLGYYTPSTRASRNGRRDGREAHRG